MSLRFPNERLRRKIASFFPYFKKYFYFSVELNKHFPAIDALSDLAVPKDLAWLFSW